MGTLTDHGCARACIRCLEATDYLRRTACCTFEIPICTVEDQDAMMSGESGTQRVVEVHEVGAGCAMDEYDRWAGSVICVVQSNSVDVDEFADWRQFGVDAACSRCAHTGEQHEQQQSCRQQGAYQPLPGGSLLSSKASATVGHPVGAGVGPGRYSRFWASVSCRGASRLA